MMQDKVFKKYDIRGHVYREFEILDIYDVSRAIAFYFLQKNPKLKNIAIGMDGRNHSFDIKEQVCAAFIDSGIDVTFIGLCPTPTLYFATHILPVQAGIMITASHNPKEDNGLKLILDKESIWSDQIEEIRDLYKKNIHIKTSIKGSYKENLIVEKYVDYLVNQFQHLKGAQINAAIDCGNGAAGSVLPLLIEKFQWKNVHLLFGEVDGNYPNHEPDPTVSENMKDLKKYLFENNNIEFGMGLDGDCDRLAAMTKNGLLIPGDQLLGIFCQSLPQTKNSSIVFDVKCSNGLSELIENLGMKSFITPTGHAYIKQKMKETDSILAGELSGHYCFKDKYFGYDDGIYALIRLIDILKTSGQKIEKLLEKFPTKISSREFRINCTEDKKNQIINEVKNYLSKKSNCKILEIDGIRIETDYGWGLLRASNTQEMLSLRFEGNNAEGLKKIKNDFFEPISNYFDKEWLKKSFEL